MRARTTLPLGACLLLCLAVGGYFLLRPVAVVSVSLPGQGDRIAASVPASPENMLRMKYIHSVERTPVEGRFAIAERGGFRAMETRTTGTGTGLPNVVPEGRVTTTEERFIINEQGKYYPEIPFYYLDLNNLRILVGDKRLDLEEVPDGSRLKITSRTEPTWKWLLSGGFLR